MKKKRLTKKVKQYQEEQEKKKHAKELKKIKKFLEKLQENLKITIKMINIIKEQDAQKIYLIKLMKTITNQKN